MLRRLLQLVTEQGSVSHSELACKLGISQALLEQMLGELVRQGYLQPLDRGNPIACERCPKHTACLSGNGPRVLALTLRNL